MKHWLLICLGIVAMAVGCGDSTVSSTPPAEADSASGNDAGESTAATDGAAAPDAGGSQPTSGSSLELSPENTSIEFIGNHTGDDPKPRHGSFQQFSGKATVDGTLKHVSVDIDTTSLKTGIDKLTNHLKNADFFDVNQFPKASFKSTEIKDNGDGTVQITGDLTLLGTTTSVTFPASVDTASGLKMNAEFEIDRTQWGMNYGPDQIEKMVPMKITIGG
jgi:polyisoprenoid-binding protein YceI